MRTSGHWVFTSGRSPRLARKRSATASLIFSAAKFRLVRGLCCAVTSILKVCLVVNQISQATSLAALYKSFSLRYIVCDSCTSTRCAKRQCRFSSMASRQEARTITPPRPVIRSLPVRPVMPCTSSAKKPSTPAAQGKNNCSEFTVFYAGWRARFSAPRGIWPPCAVRSRCLAL